MQVSAVNTLAAADPPTRWIPAYLDADLTVAIEGGGSFFAAPARW
jgi:hypothetical protein